MRFEDAIVSLLVIDGQVRHLFCLRSVPLGFSPMAFDVVVRVGSNKRRESPRSR